VLFIDGKNRQEQQQPWPVYRQSVSAINRENNNGKHERNSTAATMENKTCRQDPIHQGSQKDQRSWPLTLRDLRKPKIRRRRDSDHWIEHCEEFGPLDHSPDKRNECEREELDPIRWI
jgi:hypothetical protein